MTEISLDVSIVICSRNRCRTLDGTLESLAAIQSRHRWEVLLADNASTDETAAVIRRADDCGGRLRYARVERIGLGAARDAAWRQTRGRIVAFTDDDCYLASDYVDAIVRVFDDHPEVGCVGGQIRLHDPEDARVTIDEREEPTETAGFRFVDAGAFHGANLSFRRSILERVGGIDVGLGAGTPFPCEDIDAVAACLWSGAPARFDPRPVVRHHHRRREQEVDGLLIGYDRGRGAYYAKYLLRGDTRRAYLRGWWGLAAHHQTFYGIIRLTREIGGGFAYLRARNATAFIVAAAPVAALGYSVCVAVIGWRVLRQRLKRQASRLTRG